MLVLSLLYMSLTLVMITWREPFLMFLTHQSSSVEESKRLNAYVCSYRLSKKKLSLGKDSVIIDNVFLEREHFWNSYNQNYMVYEPTFDCRVVYTQTNATQSHDICHAITRHLSNDCVTTVKQSLGCSSFSLKTVVEHRFPPRR